MYHVFVLTDFQLKPRMNKLGYYVIAQAEYKLGYYVIAWNEYKLGYYVISWAENNWDIM